MPVTLPPELTYRPSPAEINALPLHLYEGPIHVVRNEDDWSSAADALNAESLLGFDTETQPTFRKGRMNDPALVQLATQDAVYLIQLGWFPFDQRCASLLASKHVIKAGVSIRDDMAALGRITPFVPDGVADIGEMARKAGLPNHGLRTLAASLFGWRISKNAQCSNWSDRNLSPRQIRYAATDAWLSRKLYLRLQDLGLTNG